MSARGRFLSVLVTIVVALAGFVGLGALPAAAAPSAVQYVPLGDSYAAGQGAPPYLNICLQTAQSYPELLDDSQSRIDLQENPTCSGAKTSTVAAMQLPVLTSDTRLVTLTVGAANLDLSGLLTVCTTQPPAKCREAIDLRVALLPELGSKLTDLYTDVGVVAPRARVVVTGYPHLFEPLNPLFIAINDAIDQLNSTIEQAVSVANDADVNIHYVDVTAAFAGHGIGADPELLFINPPDPENPADPDAFHPTAAGYQAYANAISAALPGGWFDKQKQSA